jgi:hypothetical protein
MKKIPLIAILSLFCIEAHSVSLPGKFKVLERQSDVYVTGEWIEKKTVCNIQKTRDPRADSYIRNFTQAKKRSIGENF